MTLNKHLIQGLDPFNAPTIAAATFEQKMNDAGYTNMGSAPAQGKRVKVWWVHSSHPRVESIYSQDMKTVITAYHVN